MELWYDMKLKDTGESRTKTYNIRAYFCVVNDKVCPCPVHVYVRKGYRNRRHNYQLVPPDHAVLELTGSGKPELSTDDLWDHLHINAKGRAARLFIESAEDGVIRKVWEDMLNSVPGRFNYWPPGAQFLETVRAPIDSIADFINLTETVGYPPYRPGWYRGGRIKAGRITPTRQGNLVGRSTVSVPVWLWHGVSYDAVRRTDAVEIRGTEDNAHTIKFEREVEVLQREAAALVYSYRPVEFEITHPQHKKVEGRLRGLVEFVHYFRE